MRSAAVSPGVPAFNTALPVLVMRVGHYPLHHGTLGVLRSLGRVGVPVYTVTESRSTPAARSRYCAGAFVLRSDGSEPPAVLIDEMLRMSDRISTPSLVVCTDDEAAVLVAEHRSELAGRFVLPEAPPGLPRVLASKRGLLELCREFGVDSPAGTTPRSAGELAEFARTAAFPLMVKNLEPFTRLLAPAVRANTVVRDRGELELLAAAWREPYSVMLQEYLPPQLAEDWIVHAYFGADARPRALFTGFKVRSWPPYAGVTCRGRTVVNRGLAELSARFCAEIGYRGLADLDWRFDRRDGRYKLLDFNPRLGAQFRMFDDELGIDVVRAMHLDLSGREVPPAPPVEGRDLVLEHLELPALLGYRHRGVPTPAPPIRRRSTRLAWLAEDDPLPALVAYATAARELFRLVRGLLRRPQPGRPARLPAGLPARDGEPGPLVPPAEVPALEGTAAGAAAPDLPPPPAGDDGEGGEVSHRAQNQWNHGWLWRHRTRKTLPMMLARGTGPQKRLS